MPNFKVHSISGIVGGTILVSIISIFENKMNIEFSIMSNIIAIGYFYLMAIFPDIDIKSTSSKIIYTLSLILAIYLFYIKAFIFLFIFLIFLILPQLSKHRGIFHSLISALIIPAIIFILYFQNILTINDSIFYYLIGFCGYCTHLILDYVI